MILSVSSVSEQHLPDSGVLAGTRIWLILAEKGRLTRTVRKLCNVREAVIWRRTSASL